MVREFAHVGMPYCYRCDFDCTDGCRNCGQQYAAELERAIEAANGEAAAFIFEPVSGATLGAVVPPPGYLQSIAEICRRHGVLLIADEVMTGMGRTGRNFAVEHWNVAPDILVTAKGLSSGYAPLGAVIASKKVVDAIAAGSGAFLHGFTYNAHPISLAAGRAVLRHLQAKKLVEAADSSRAGTPAAHFKQALETLRAKRHVGDVRGIGLLWAVEFVADKASKRPFPPDQNFAGRVAAAALKRGLLVYPMQGSVDGISGDHLLLAPPPSSPRNRSPGRSSSCERPSHRLLLRSELRLALPGFEPAWVETGRLTPHALCSLLPHLVPVPHEPSQRAVLVDRPVIAQSRRAWRPRDQCLDGNLILQQGIKGAQHGRRASGRRVPFGEVGGGSSGQLA